MTFDEIREIALAYPGVSDHVTYGTPSLKVGGKFLLREREPGLLVLQRPSRDERDLLLEAEPELFFITDHYRDYPYVLVRMERLEPERFRTLFETIWRDKALKKHLAAFGLHET
ncbi:MmcQ/YjbR family DNA-binding protein [Pelagibacterium limicola]|uniref:MmcQ/YjbR family DNA-binding protein n=1 Tax=Pelagibacterium limicola TaxID=2791022 RepID=UPI0018AFF927|nr:MmcQ/YjbR family DNA-binding protein [Pelagibacterium limicola]